MAVLNTVNGYVRPDALTKALDEAVKTNDQLQTVDREYAAAVVSDSRDYDLWRRALKMYSKVRLWDKAVSAAQRVRALDAANKKGDAADAVFAMLSAVQDAPAADEKAKAEQAARISELRQQIRGYDPVNEHGVLQKTLLVQALEALNQIRQDMPQSQRQTLLRSAAQTLGELTAKARKLDDPVNIHYLHGRVLAELSDKKGAEAAFQKAIEADPQGPAADQLRKIIEDMNKSQS